MDMAVVFGPTFGDELFAAGLGGLPFSWTPSTGAMTGRENLTTDQNTRLDSVIAKHDPTQTTYLASTLDMGGTTAEILGED